MKLRNLDDLFLCLLSDIYKVENQIVKDLPMLIQKVESDDLKKALQEHLSETKEQVMRLDRIFRSINQNPKEIEWESDVLTLFKDVQAFVSENTTSPLLDAAIIAIAQRIEHFEIATYGTLREFAKVLEHEEAYALLKDTIKEEGHADKILTKIAEKGINVVASQR